ncbi:carbon-nitrogen family hydrolase [Arthrobacter woluwensis]|uniref:carbon-nitrogen family hydrolase n=1 Tax=Arthrobacter woluwensis TaxID=156980 RepID=UPI001AAFF5DC|nr:carbon-nitrogen family hydrolase [Arthrobacter woluwensis]MDQ0710452.1 putative amidohydrolase [Arthrobacter woluwensis]QTF73010.1 carbon-nitrogen family hydrolase [Arthrobacter woluwensis]
MEISLIQLSSPDAESQADRIDRAESLIRAQEGADLVVLPELWSAGYFHFGQYPDLAETLDGPTATMCAAVARDLKTHVHLGSIVERISADRLRNTSVLLGPDGSIVHQYSKIHVFGYQSLEAELLTPGTSLPVARTPFGTMAGITCYDLRFPGIWSELSTRGAGIVVVPAAWPAARREHWRLLTSARAVEHQMFVLACNATGVQEGVELGGTSRVVDPTGRLLAEAGAEEDVLRATIDPAQIEAVRREFPVITDRLDDYAGLSH